MAYYPIILAQSWLIRVCCSCQERLIGDSCTSIFSDNYLNYFEN